MRNATRLRRVFFFPRRRGHLPRLVATLGPELLEIPASIMGWHVLFQWHFRIAGIGNVDRLQASRPTTSIPFVVFFLNALPEPGGSVSAQNSARQGFEKILRESLQRRCLLDDSELFLREFCAARRGRQISVSRWNSARALPFLPPPGPPQPPSFPRSRLTAALCPPSRLETHASNCPNVRACCSQASSDAKILHARFSAWLAENCL